MESSVQKIGLFPFSFTEEFKMGLCWVPYNIVLYLCAKIRTILHAAFQLCKAIRINKKEPFLFLFRLVLLCILLSSYIQYKRYKSAYWRELPRECDSFQLFQNICQISIKIKNFRLRQYSHFQFLPKYTQTFQTQ